jgi:hypothetical protein
MVKKKTINHTIDVSKEAGRCKRSGEKATNYQSEGAMNGIQQRTLKREHFFDFGLIH